MKLGTGFSLNGKKKIFDCYDCIDLFGLVIVNTLVNMSLLEFRIILNSKCLARNSRKLDPKSRKLNATSNNESGNMNSGSGNRIQM